LHSAKQILSSGKLLSATGVYGKSGEQLAFEKRDSLWNDPADYFEYIMFAWGNSDVGDYVVMSDNPIEEQGDEFFKRGSGAGIRFYFRFDDLLRHPGHVFDGYHPMKVHNEIVLSEYLHACIVPEQYGELRGFVMPELAERVFCLPQIGLSISEWTKKAYDFITKPQ
jgi:hypothetical protein